MKQNIAACSSISIIYAYWKHRNGPRPINLFTYKALSGGVWNSPLKSLMPHWFTPDVCTHTLIYMSSVAGGRKLFFFLLEYTCFGLRDLAGQLQTMFVHSGSLERRLAIGTRDVTFTYGRRRGLLGCTSDMVCWFNSSNAFCFGSRPTDSLLCWQYNTLRIINYRLHNLL